MEFQKIAETLGQAKRTGNGFDCKCPCHDDDHASLSLSMQDGRLLWHCKAGCSQADVQQALQARGLINGHPYEPKAKNETVWKLRDADGNHILNHVRIDGPDGKKESMFWQRTDGRKANFKEQGLKLVDLPLYNFHKVKNASKLILCEGEKAADACAKLGLPAVATATGAASCPSAKVLRCLQGKHVLLWPDNDDPGREHMRKIAARLDKLKIEYRFIQWADAGPKQDAADFVKAGHGIDDFKVLPRVKALPETKKEPGGEYRPKKQTITTGRELSDLGNGERFRDQNKDDVRFVPGLGWMFYDGRRWIHDAGEVEVRRRAFMTARNIREEALDADPKTYEKLAHHAGKSEGDQRLNAMLHIAEALLSAKAEDFDRNIYLLNVENGTLNLITGDLQPHDRADYLTKLAPVSYDIGADIPKFWGQLETVFQRDRELIKYVQTLVGYSLSGDISGQCFVILTGIGANGKSTMIVIFRRILGDYAKEANFSSFLSSRNQTGESPRHDLAMLKGSRFVCASESDVGKRLDEGTLQAISGGEPITCRHMYRSPFTYQPEFKLWLSCNRLPRVASNTEAIWRRIKVIPFNHVFPKEERRPFLPLVEELLEEKSGILNWALMGFQEYWQAKRLQDPKAVLDATGQYRGDEDAFGQFLEDCTLQDPEAFTPSKSIFEAFKTWCESNGESTKYITQRMLSQHLKAAGYVADRNTTARGWKGIRIK